MKNLHFNYWVASFLLCLVGCSEKTPTTYPVLVKVAYPDGTPVVNAQVVFRSSEFKISARGSTGKDGSCRLTTFTAGDGALLGQHQVIVAKPPLIGDPDDPYTGPLIANKFASLSTSGLEATVTNDEAQNIIALTVTRR